MIVERIIGLSETPPRALIAKLVRWFITFHLVCLSWVFFRATDIGHAWEVLTRIATNAPGEAFGVWEPIALVLVLVFVELGRVRKRFVYLLQHHAFISLCIAIAAFILFVLMFRGASSPEFIYFQF